MSPTEIQVLKTKMRMVIELQIQFSAELKELTEMISQLPETSPNPAEFLEVALKIENLRRAFFQILVQN